MATSDAQTETAEERRETTPATQSRSNAGSFLLAALLGGFLAGGIGYIAGYFTDFGLFSSQEEGADLSQTVEQQLARLDAVEARLQETGDPSAVAQEELSSVQDRLADIVGRLDTVETQASGEGQAPDNSAQLEQLGRTVQDLESRITELPADAAASERVSQLSQTVEDLQAQTSQANEASQGTEGRVSELQNRIAALEQRLTEQDQAMQSAQQAAQAEAQQVSARAALAEIRAAIANGSGYPDAIETLRSAGSTQVPDALAAPAGEGVALISSLQDSFPQAARDALSASVAETTNGPLDRTLAFLRAQTGARSLSEQQGSGPNAILSRAEARLSEGDLQAAVSELGNLPPGGQDAMSDWLGQARTRVQATTALDDLTQNMTEN